MQSSSNLCGFDRGEGGPENLENAGYKINSIFKYDHKENKLI